MDKNRIKLGIAIYSMPFPLSANARFQPIPHELRETLAPAQVALFEWDGLFFSLVQCRRARCGRAAHRSDCAGRVFACAGKNALGLASLTPLRQNAALEAPLWVEVLSPKFPTPEKHVAFLRALLERLFALSPHLIWRADAATARGAQNSARQMSAPETLDWALRTGDELKQTLAAIARQPARDWISHSVDAMPALVSALNATQLSVLASEGRALATRGARRRCWRIGADARATKPSKSKFR